MASFVNENQIKTQMYELDDPRGFQLNHLTLC